MKLDALKFFDGSHVKFHSAILDSSFASAVSFLAYLPHITAAFIYLHFDLNFQMLQLIFSGTFEAIARITVSLGIF